MTSTCANRISMAVTLLSALVTLSTTARSFGNPFKPESKITICISTLPEPHPLWSDAEKQIAGAVNYAADNLRKRKTLDESDVTGKRLEQEVQKVIEVMLRERTDLRIRRNIAASKQEKSCTLLLDFDVLFQSKNLKNNSDKRAGVTVMEEGIRLGTVDMRQILSIASKQELSEMRKELPSSMLFNDSLLKELVRLRHIVDFYSPSQPARVRYRQSLLASAEKVAREASVAVMIDKDSVSFSSKRVPRDLTLEVQKLLSSRE